MQIPTPPPTPTPTEPSKRIPEKPLHPSLTMQQAKEEIQKQVEEGSKKELAESELERITQCTFSGYFGVHYTALPGYFLEMKVSEFMGNHFEFFAGL